MPRPQHLGNLASALPYSDDNGLTPRTPHSRTARLEGGFAKLQVGEVDDFEMSTFAQQQSAPLLHSSTSSRFAGRPQSNKHVAVESREPLSRTSRVLAAFGVVLAGALLVLIIVSYTNQPLLMRTFGLDRANLHPSTSSHGGLSYQNYTSFPLLGTQYLHECAKQMSGFMSHGDYWEAPRHHDAPMDVDHANDPHNRICNSTITYLLDGKVGLAADLGLMAQAAALAQERNRTFFVDDTHWTRGKWTEYFEDVTSLQRGPEPGCLPPPPQEFVACPRTARHWVINSLTAKYHLGHSFEEHYEDPYGHQLNRKKPVFDMAQKSFASTIRPNEEMRTLINVAKSELLRKFPSESEQLEVDKHATLHRSYYSVHIRRGDRIPHGWMHHRKPIATQVYIDAIFQRLHKSGSPIQSSQSPVVYLASDSPSMLEQFAKAYNGTTFSLPGSKHSELNILASPQDYHQEVFDKLPLQARRKATKGALIDLALVTRLWEGEQEPRLDSAVVSVSSNFGRLAAIGLGWEGAFGNVDEMGDIDNTRKKWIDVDLQGTELPVWQAFELF